MINDYISKYLDRLTYLYIKANTISKKNKISHDLLVFTNLYNKIYPNKILPWDNDIDVINNVLDMELDSTKSILNNIIKDNNIYLNMSNNIIDIYKDTNYPFYKYPICKYKKVDKYIDKSMYEFLNSYDPYLYNLLINKIKDKEIFYDYNMNEYNGETHNIEVLNKNFILLEDKNIHTINENLTIIHEIGHAYEFNLLYNNKHINSMYTPYYEISSLFFEYAYMNYLKENRLLDREIDMVFDNYYKELLLDIIDINMLANYFNITEDILVNDNYITINDEELFNKRNDIKDKLNYYMYLSNEKKYDFLNTYIYGIGRVLSVILYDIYKDNPKEFKKEFNILLNNYSKYDSITCFDSIGINKDEIENNNVLKKVLSNLT